jgi:hypothetical protein
MEGDVRQSTDAAASIKNAEGPIEMLANTIKESVLQVEKKNNDIVIVSVSDVLDTNVMPTAMEGVEVLQTSDEMNHDGCHGTNYPA